MGWGARGGGGGGARAGTSAYAPAKPHQHFADEVLGCLANVFKLWARQRVLALFDSLQHFPVAVALEGCAAGEGWCGDGARRVDGVMCAPRNRPKRRRRGEEGGGGGGKASYAACH